MICCKIVTNLKKKEGKVSDLFQNLAKKGDFIVFNNYLYFCESESNFSEKDLKKMLKKYGFSEFFLDIYDKENLPRETEEINAWVYNELMKINYNMYEQENQKVFKDISKGLDLLDREIENIKNNNKETSHN